MRLKWTVWAAFIPLVFSFFWGYKNYRKVITCQQANQELMRRIRGLNFKKSVSFSIKEGEPITSSIILKTIDGKTMALSDAGTYLLVFISSTCGACLEGALDVFNEVREFENRGLNIIAVSRDDPESLEELTTGMNWPFVIAQDPDGRVHRMFNVVGAPAIVLIHEARNMLKADALAIDGKLSRLKHLLSQYAESATR